MKQAAMFSDPEVEQAARDGLREGRTLRDEGLAKVLNHGADEVLICRRWALYVAHYKGRVAADDVRQYHELPSRLHPNTWGATFADKRLFKKVGYQQSSTPSRRAGTQAVYELTEYGRTLAEQVVREVERKMEGT